MKSFLVSVEVTPCSFGDNGYFLEYVMARTATAAVNAVMRERRVTSAFRASAFECEPDKEIKLDRECVQFDHYTYRLPRGAAVQS